MTIKQIDDILQHPKDYWSHEVEEAKEAAKQVVHIIALLQDRNGEEIRKMMERRNENRNEN